MADDRHATMSKNWEDESTRPAHIQVYIENFGPIPIKHRVHHIDNNHDNNDPNNLIALPRAFHKSIHSDYYFYYNLATQGRINKKVIQELLEYYRNMGYSLSKKFSTTLVEYLLLNYDPSLKPEMPPIVKKEPTPDMLKRVRLVLAPFYKQNELLFGSGGIHSKLSKEQVDNCLKKLLKTASALYLEIK